MYDIIAIKLTNNFNASCILAYHYLFFFLELVLCTNLGHLEMLTLIMGQDILIRYFTIQILFWRGCLFYLI